MDSTQDSTRYVVSSLHHGGIMPGKRSEMWRDVFLLSGADVRGGVWANELSVIGPSIKVSGAVYSRSSIAIKNADEPDECKDPVVFGSCLTSPDSLRVEAVPYRVRFMSDVYVSQMSLDHSIVFGNIFSNRLSLTNSIVLGGAYIRDHLKIENSMISTFRTKHVELGRNVFLLSPFALSEDPISVDHPVRALPFYRICADSRGEGEGAVVLDQDDVFRLSEASEDRDDDSGDAGREAAVKDLYCLSMTERILDSKSIAEYFESNAKFLQYLSLGSHFDPELRDQAYTMPVDRLEDYLWDLVTLDKPIRQVTGGTSMTDAIARFAPPEAAS
jgi:hypothetical protein